MESHSFRQRRSWTFTDVHRRSDRRAAQRSDVREAVGDTAVSPVGQAVTMTVAVIEGWTPQK